MAIMKQKARATFQGLLQEYEQRMASDQTSKLKKPTEDAVLKQALVGGNIHRIRATVPTLEEFSHLDGFRMTVEELKANK